MTSKIRRILSLVLTACFIFSSFTTVVLAENKSVGEAILTDYTSYSADEAALSYLQMLGIMGDFDLDANVTRGQAVSTLVRAMAQEDIALKTSGSMYTYDEKMAFLAHNCGIFSGSVPAEWNLDSYVTGFQFAKMLVTALGYGSVITSENAYPAEYLAYAGKLGINKGTSQIGEIAISGSDFVIMLANAMKAKVLEVVGIYDDEAMYEVSSDKTLESIYLDLKNLSVGTGIIDADFYTSAVPGGKCEYSRIKIDGNVYSCESEKLKGYVGCRVDFVYSDEKSESKRFIQGICLSDENIICSFSSGHNAYYKSGAFYYEGANGKEETITLSSEAVYIVNNKILTSYNLASVNFEDYILRFIDNNADKKCDVVFLTKSENMIVNYVKDDIIYLSFGTLNSKNIIDLSDYDSNTESLIVRDINGTPKTIADISADDGISVIASDDFGYIEIIILPPASMGKFEEYNSEDNIVVVNGVSYGMKIASDDFTLGNTYSFRVNENNEIFYVETVLSDCSYIVDIAKSSENLSDGVKIKLYDNENGIQIFEANQKVVVGGVTYSADELVSVVNKGELAYVNLTSENKVRKIEYLNKFGESAKRIYRQQASGFNDITLDESLPFRFNDDTVFFYVPKSGNDEDFGFSLPFKNKDEYTTTAYEYDEETGFVKAVVVEVDNDMRSDNYITYSSDVGIVKKITQVSDKDQQGVYKIEGYHDGAQFIYTSGHYDDVFAVCASLKAGDVIRYIVNYNNEIVRIQKIVSLADVKEFFHDGKDTTDERFYGQVITLSKNVLTNYSEYLCHEMNVSMNSSYNNMSFMRLFADLVNPYDSKSQFSNYYTYNQRTKEVTPAGIDDIISYEMAGDAASNVFIQRSKSDVQCIVIVKE